MRYKFIDCIECSPASEANIFSAKKIPLFYALRTFTTIFYSNIYSTRCNVIQFILPGRCSTCFGWYLHPSSGAQTNVSTAYGICHTVTATCCYRGRVETGLSVLWVAYATHSTQSCIFLWKVYYHITSGTSITVSSHHRNLHDCHIYIDSRTL